MSTRKREQEAEEEEELQALPKRRERRGRRVCPIPISVAELPFTLAFLPFGTPGRPTLRCFALRSEFEQSDRVERERACISHMPLPSFRSFITRHKRRKTGPAPREKEEEEEVEEELEAEGEEEEELELPAEEEEEAELPEEEEEEEEVEGGAPLEANGQGKQEGGDEEEEEDDDTPLIKRDVRHATEKGAADVAAKPTAQVELDDEEE
ncbi:hypothetical protein CISG_00194 [Coccidioides immitis RMSCC 3703]|uniref:Uncharacterized protein n=1 Tax=Coccidioides immitis RMSCC 3703 TaxID=454286 RepID=A0A0J8QHG1_COCIT|nr:hypothetical protein CISG_00194 [Coccidioides immitis RMSCC 3703]